MKINKIARINGFRIFQNWKPDADLGDFRDINVVYANNGSGKSTLAELLNPTTSPDGWKNGVALEVDQGSGPYQTTSPDDPVVSSIVVFNRDYIDGAFDFEASNARALLSLGKENVSRERDLRDKRKLLADELAKRPQLDKDLTAAQKQQKSIYSDLGRTITATLGSVPKYHPRSYNAVSVKKSVGRAMDQDDIATFDDQKHIAIVTSAGMPAIGFSVKGLDSLPVFSLEILEKLLSEVPTATPIPALTADSSHSTWVQAGLQIHHADDNCLFCGGKITKDRLDELGRHFDDSTKDLQERIRSSIDVCSQAISAATELKNSLPDENLLYDDMRIEYRKLKAQFLADLDQLGADWLEVKSTLEEKNSKVFEQLPAPINVVPTVPDGVAIQAVVDEHNNRSSAHSEHVSNSATELERFWIGQKVGDIQSAEVSLKTAIERDQKSREVSGKLETEISQLERADLDPVPSAEWLNSRLSRLLGRDELRVKSVGGGKYELQRSGVPARNLSEGEKTALTLLYFLKSLSSHDRALANSIVVIDDPVSSLDENFTIGVSALIWAELVQRDICRCGKSTPCGCGQKPVRECGQLFLFTHNFEFFRIWTNQLDRLDGGARKAGRRYRILELRTRASKGASGSIARVPEWYEWDQNEGPKTVRNKLRSEYHYLFWRAADTLTKCGNQPTPEEELDAAVVLPNVCRRLLEGFLSFRFPEEMGDFRVQMKRAIDHVDDGATRQRLVNYLHQYSHNEQVETTRGVNRPESVVVLRTVFELIREQDRSHFEGMCAALDIDTAGLGI